MKHEALIIGGPFDGARTIVESNDYHVTLGDTKYSRVSRWMVGGQHMFAVAKLSTDQLMELLVLSYEKLRKIEKEAV